MSAWRRRAIACCPELRAEFEDPATTIYGVFPELLSQVVKAHECSDHETLARIYAYAAWCFRQRAQALWNAAGVSFYEHLVDEEITRNAMPAWISQEAYLELRPLFAARMTDAELAELDRSFRRANQSRLRH